MPRVALVGAFVCSAPAAILLALSACGEPTEPPDSVPPVAMPIAVGDTVVASFTAEDTIALFTVHSSDPLEFAVFLQAEQGGFDLQAVDSTTGVSLAFASAEEDPEPGHLTLRRTAIISADPGDVVLLHLRPLSSGSPGRLRLWCYPINRAPETLPDTMAVDVILEGEDLVNSADIDEFSLEGSAGDEWILFVQGLGAVIPGTVYASIFSPAGENIEVAGGGAAGAELESQSSGRFLLPANGRYRVEVGQLGTEGSEAATGSGSFRVVIRRIDRRPEHVPEQLAPGDTLQGESVDFVGDVDEFQVPLLADSSYNVFLQTSASAGLATLRASISWGGGQVLEVASVAGDTALARQFTGNFTAVGTVNAMLRITGEADDRGLHRGAYRLFVYPVNRAPEIAGPDIAAGDSLVESVEYPGDIDEFRLSPSGGGAVSLVLQRSDAREETLQLRWGLDGHGATMNCFVIPGQTGARCGSGRIGATGPLNLSVASEFGATTPFRGAYRLVTVPLDLDPEGIPASVSLGEAITEEIDPAGDADQYMLSYSAGDLIELGADGGGGSTADGFQVVFFDPGGSFLPGYADLVPVSSGRFTLPSSGTYRLQISGASGGTNEAETGSYTFTIRRVSSLAEVVSAPIAIGDSVTAEPIGQVGDVDDFVVAGPPGAEVQVFVRGTTRLVVDAIVPGTSTLVRAGTNFATGRLMLPGTGRIGLRVYEPRTFSGALREHGMSYVGPYAIAVHQVDPNPETIGVPVTLGTVVEGEAVDFEGDVDEFTFAGTGGQTIAGRLSAPMGGFSPTGVQLQVIDSSTDQVLGSADTFDATEVATGSIVLPATRTYLVRVQGVSDTEGRGGYRFMID